jgi:twitching motility protein PilJ
MQSMLNSVFIADDAIQTYERTTEVISNTLGTLTSGKPELDIYVPKKDQDALMIDRLKTMRQISVLFTQDIVNFKKTIVDVRSAKQAAYNVGLTADQSLNVLKELTGQYNLEQKDIDQLNILAISFALLSLLIGFFWIWLKLQETRLTTAQVEESIMHLMSDLMSISDGNLATRARVAENITGSIADSLNLTIARLNLTLSDVKESSQTVSDGADQMTNDASVILEAVRDQSNKIREASSSVNSIADSVQAVAFAAEQSSEVAEMQRNVTEQGREAVKNTIAAMNAIREQIQNTAKRIKRVGESAQEIDEIIELISDTTEQTNVLAMNASIQAAAAGEAGRGFRAVATEVQRLAERSDQSLRKIVGLIRTMQSETQNAVSAMEASTQEVVNGAQTTSRAGEALTKIEEVSSELNGLIAAITEATQQQTNEAKVITDSMSDILQISTSTARGVEQTTTGIQTIASLAEELDNAMDQFTLQ